MTTIAYRLKPLLDKLSEEFNYQQAVDVGLSLGDLQKLHKRGILTRKHVTGERYNWVKTGN